MNIPAKAVFLIDKSYKDKQLVNFLPEIVVKRKPTQNEVTLFNVLRERGLILLIFQFENAKLVTDSFRNNGARHAAP